MRVAIMGAGLSGLSCAITLEKHGVMPDVYEKRRLPGDRFVNGEAIFHILNKPINDCLPYFEKEFGIILKPISIIRNMIIYSEKYKAEIKGNVGYTNIRGRHDNSFENQLASQVKSEISYNSDYTYEQLLKEFDKVVIATGEGEFASQLGNYKVDLTTSLKGATVEGKFVTDSPAAWLNYSFAPKGYGYLIPFSDKEATIVIGYPDYPDTIVQDAHTLFEMFYRQVCNDLGQDLRITDNFEITRYLMGICNKPKIQNTYFIGNAFGSIMPAFGFGQFIAVLTGVYAAWDILGLGNYEELSIPLRTAYDNSLVLRRYMETLDNERLDSIVKSLNNNLVDMVFDNKGTFDYVKVMSYILKLFV